MRSCAVAALALSVVCAHAQSGMFPYVIPWDDASVGTATDVSFLNEKPAGANGFIVPKNGHFVQSKTGKPIRFFGANLCDAAAFPSREDADKVAAHLAKLGINLVRFHHLQNDWGPKQTIWKPGKSMIEVDPAKLDRLDYLIYALKKNGIYVNLNLQTTRTYVPELGFPESVRKIKTSFCKKVDTFDRRMIELQKQYAKELLDRRNPYTGLRYKDEPALAVVEINNENSLLPSYWEPFGADLFDLPEPFRGELVGLWNQWLTRKYKNDKTLKRAWMAGVTPVGPSVVGPTNRWELENHSNGDVAMEVRPAPAGRAAAPGMSVTVRSNPGPDWHVQTTLAGLNLKEGATYTLRFRARADKERSVPVNVTLDRSDWRFLGLSAPAKLGPEWRNFSFPFAATGTEEGHSRVVFVVGAAPGRVEVERLSLSPGAPGPFLPSGQSLAKRNVDIDGPALARRRSDFTDFLADTEKAYAEEMRAYLKQDLGVRANVVDTQITYGGATGYNRESSMEFVDNHAYWEHPVFPNKSWDSVDWTIRNTPMTNEMDGGLGELGSLARFRVDGKPYTISEYNHPAPSDFQAEMMPLLSTFASLQDWDAIYSFCYEATASGQPNDKINGYFNIAADAAKSAFFPSTALIFRAGLVPSIERKAVLVLPKKPWAESCDANWSWRKHGGVPSAYAYRLGVAVGEGSASKLIADPAPAEPPVLGAVRTPDGAVFRADAPAAKAVTGYVSGQTVALGGATFAFPKFENRFAALTLVAMDCKPLAESKRVLLTLVGRVENQEMGWNATRTSVGDRWGHGPVVAEGIPCKVTLAVSGPRKVYVLDPAGKRLRSLDAGYSGGVLTFEVGPKERALCYEVTP